MNPTYADQQYWGNRKSLVVTTDGSLSNGKTAFGCVVRDGATGEVVNEYRAFGNLPGTSNEAEYGALLHAANVVFSHVCRKDAEVATAVWGGKIYKTVPADYDGKILFFTDSELLLRHLRGDNKVTSMKLNILKKEIIKILKLLKATVRWHSREHGDGPRADALASQKVGRDAS